MLQPGEGGRQLRRLGVAELSAGYSGSTAAAGRLARGAAMLPDVSLTPSTSDTALAYLRRRERLLVRLARVNTAISRRNEWEANAHMPGDLRRDVPQSTLPREALDGLHRMLTEELGRLDGVTVDDK